MKLVDANETVIVVTGGAAAADQKDRPLALWLKDEIDRRGAGMTYRRAVVVADDRYVGTPGFHRSPTVAIGGPGVNEVVRELTGALPTVWTSEDRSFIQMAPDGPAKQVAVWGVDAAATRNAVEAFVEQGILDLLLDRIWSWQPRTLA